MASSNEVSNIKQRIESYIRWIDQERRRIETERRDLNEKLGMIRDIRGLAEKVLGWEQDAADQTGEW